MISINLLCVPISKCSIELLYTNVERFTATFLFLVGRGIGPATFAPVLIAVSMMLLSFI